MLDVPLLNREFDTDLTDDMLEYVLGQILNSKKEKEVLFLQ